MKSIFCLLFSLFSIAFLSAQSYDSYFTGSSIDIETNPEGGVCLMGGATESDEAMQWFLKRADGGDILVLRASGSDGYNDYMFSELGIQINSVESIVFNQAEAANDSYILDKISKAEGIWFAGGNQWNYVNYWRDSAIDSSINLALQNRNIVIGGTSAGMAILSQFYFSAENGTVTSTQASENPYHPNVTVDSTAFIKLPALENIVTDTHYDNPNRRARHLAFLARIYTDYGIKGKGIACDEYTAVCIDENMIATVYGSFPEYDDNAYFIQFNCELDDNTPETCSPNQPLDWYRDGKAVKVCILKGTPQGISSFDLKQWEAPQTGLWEYWSMDEGSYNGAATALNDCIVPVYEENKELFIKTSPNPFVNELYLESELEPQQIELYTLEGKKINIELKVNTPTNVAHLPKGVYLLKLRFPENLLYFKLMKQ